MRYELKGDYNGVEVSFGTFSNLQDCYKKIAKEGTGRQLFTICEIKETAIDRLTAKTARERLMHGGIKNE